MGNAGYPGPNNEFGPASNDYTNYSGVLGTAVWVTGVAGTSTNNVGVYGQSEEDPNSSIPKSISAGVFGAANTGPGVFGWSTTWNGVDFRGNLGVTGTKAAVVPFPDGTHRALYCMESPDLWFEDFGTAKLKSGRVAVKLDADFARVIKSRDYHVFVTPHGDCRGLYVRRKAANNFEVRELSGGKSNISFSYRIVGLRKDIKGHRRFAKIDMRLPLPAARAARQPAPTSAARRAFAARVKKQMRQRKPTRASAEMTACMNKKPRPDFARLLQHVPKRPK
jgi:hypothetical protein